MNNIKKYLVCFNFVLILILLHYFTFVHKSSSMVTHEVNVQDNALPELFINKTLDGQELAKTFGIEYVAVNGVSSSTSDEMENKKVIMLDDVSVIIRSVTIVNGNAIVQIEYEQDNETHKAKLHQGERLLGYTFISVNRNTLTFERDGQQSHYKIFRINKNKEHIL